MRFSRTRALAAVLLLDAVAAMTVVGVARAAVDGELPSALHGSVETQALTAGNGALALFVDPGTAYAYSTMDRDDYGGGSISYTMTARGANLNLGTIGYAVLWAAPDCGQDGNYGCISSGGMGTPNTGLHEAAGFPLYAEALYPPPPAEDGASREHVYKCIVNKDAPGEAPTGGAASDVCKQSDAVPFASWAEAPGDELRSTGFSRVAGFTTPVVAVGTSESHSDVRYIGKGKLQSTGSSAIEDIDILGGAIHIEASKATASIVSSVEGEPNRSGSCTLAGLTVNGQKTAITDISNPDVQKQLDAIRDATGYQVQIIPPSPVVLEEGEGGKQVASCRGVQVFLTDLHQGSPVPACLPPVDPGVPECVPAAGNRIELTFGSINVQQSVNDLGGALDLGDGGLVGGALSGDLGGGAGTGSLDVPSTGSPSTPLAPAGDGGGAAAAGGGSGGGAAQSPGDVAINGQLASTIGERNLGAIGALTAAASAALLGGVLLLIGVVNALGSGGRFRFPFLGP